MEPKSFSTTVLVESIDMSCSTGIEKLRHKLNLRDVEGGVLVSKDLLLLGGHDLLLVRTVRIEPRLARAVSSTDDRSITNERDDSVNGKFISLDSIEG